MGADPNYIGPEGFAAIHLAAGLEGCTGEQLLNMLLRYGGNPNLKSSDSETALHVAVMWNRETSTRILLAHGADPTIKNADGVTAFHLAANTSDHEQKCLEVLKSSYMDDSSDNDVSVFEKTLTPKFQERFKETSLVSNISASNSISLPNISGSDSKDSLDDMFLWDSEPDSSTSYFSLPKESMRSLITEVKEGEETHLVHKVVNGEASLIVGSDFEPRISMGEIPISLIRNTNETIIKEQLRRRSHRQSVQSNDRLLQRKNKIYQKNEAKSLKRTPQTIGLVDDHKDGSVQEKPKLFRSPFPLISLSNTRLQDRVEVRSPDYTRVRKTEASHHKKLFDAPMVNGKPAVIIPEKHISLSKFVSEQQSDSRENLATPTKVAERHMFNYPYSSNGNSSGTNRTPSNDDNGSNSKPPSGNEETESEFPIIQRQHAMRSVHGGETHSIRILSKTLGYVDRGTSMHGNEFNTYAEDQPNDVSLDGGMMPMSGHEPDMRPRSKDINAVQRKIDLSDQTGGSDVFITDNDSPVDGESDGNSSNYDGDISQFSSPDEVVNGAFKFDLKNSPSVTIRNRNKNRTDSSEESDKKNTKVVKRNRELNKIEETSNLPQLPRKRLNGVTSSDDEKQESLLIKDKPCTVHASPRKFENPRQKIREKLDCTFEDKSSLKSPALGDELKSFHRSKINKHHHQNWKGKNDCQCELCLTRKGHATSTASLPHCEHEQCHEDENSQFRDVTIDYDWKDVSLVESTDPEFAVLVPEELQALDCEKLKDRLVKAGECPGPITENTKNIYVKHLAKIEAGLIQKKDVSITCFYFDK